jgi:hypothetical protein
MTNDSFLGGRGDYFAEGDSLTTDARAGTLHNRAGARMLGLGEDFLAGLDAALAARCGPVADVVRKSCGRAYGRRLGERLEAELAAYFGETVESYPLARLGAALVGLFSHHGWGRPRLDFSRYATGVIVVAFEDPAEPVLLAGVLAGLFSHLTGEELDCLPATGGRETRFLLALAERVAAESDGAGDPLAELENTRA